MVVGRLLSYWGLVTFQGRAVKLREGRIMLPGGRWKMLKPVNPAGQAEDGTPDAFDDAGKIKARL